MDTRFKYINWTKIFTYFVKSILFLVAFSYLCVFLPTEAGYAQGIERFLNSSNLQSPSPKPSAIPGSDLGKRIKSLRSELEALQKADLQKKADQLNLSEIQLGREISIVQSLIDLYQQQIILSARENDLQKDLEHVNSGVYFTELRTISEKPPYPLEFLEKTLDELDQVRRNQEIRNFHLTNSSETIIKAKKDLAEAEKSRRLLNEELQNNRDPDKTSSIAWHLKQSEIGIEIAKVTIQNARIQNKIAKTELEIGEKKIQVLNSKVDKLEEQVIFSKDDLSSLIPDIDAKHQEREQEIKTIAERLEKEEKSLERYRSRLNAATSDRASSELILQVEALEESVSHYNQSMQELKTSQQYLGETKGIWQKRYQYLNEKLIYSEILGWQKDLEHLSAELKRQKKNTESTLLDIRNLINRLDKNPRNISLKSLEIREKSLGTFLNDLSSLEILSRRTLRQITQKHQSMKWSNSWNKFKNSLVELWNIEIVKVDDSSVTVYKVFIALLIVIFGLIFLQIITSILRHKVFPKMGMDEGGALAVKKIIFYLLSIVILLYALHIVSIPLTLFTFLGGAIAIAIGFGAQNLLNNFISGVIILIERPIKPQDLVEVDGDLGRVANIGARCSTISLFSGVDILIPNSFFLEKKVINWTLSDKKNRTHVAVGVVYGSPVDQVMQFMEQTVKEHSRILEYPEPVTLFTEFGKNSLNFEIYFWIFMNNFMDRRVIESDVRKRIIELFNENGIVVAFPQRDVHLDTTKPLEVQVVTDMKKTAQTKLP